jgi:hypothetical protein
MGVLARGVQARVGVIAVVAGAALVLTAIADAVPSAAPTVPAADVAIVVGVPISKTRLDHWIYIAAKGQASQAPGAPVIVPTDPPAFAGCLAQVRAKIPSLKRIPKTALREDCQQLFDSLLSTALDYIIKTRWYEDAAERVGISFTAQQVSAALLKAERRQFSNAGQYRRFLRATGQTVADIRFRVRGNLTFTALEKHDHGGQAKVDRLARALFLTETRCARYYVISDCSGAT